MHNSTDIKSRTLFIVDPAHSDQNLTGHYSHYNNALAKAAEKNNQKCIIIGQKSKNGDELGGFEYDIWGHEVLGNKILRGKICDEYFQGALEKILSPNFKRNNDDWLFFPNGTPFTLVGFAKALRSVSYTQPILIMLRYQADFFHYNLNQDDIEGLSDFFLLKNVILVSDSETLADDYKRIFPKVEINSVEIPLDFDNTTYTHIDAKEIFFFDSFGNARGEKGTHLILHAAENLREFCLLRNIHFRIQVNDPSDDLRDRIESFDLEKNKHVTFIDIAQPKSDYTDRLLSSNCVLLPYDPVIYRDRTSGILAEAMFMGIPSIVTSNTWLDREMQNYKLSNSCEFDVSNLELAIKSTYWNYDQFKSESLIMRGSFQLKANFSAVFYQLLKLRNRAHLGTIWILYPWGSTSFSDSGGGRRITQIREGLSRRGFETKTVYSNYFEDERDIFEESPNVYQIFLSPNESKNIHAGLHNGQFSKKSIQFLKDHIQESDRFVFLSTHLVVPFLKAFPEVLRERIVVECFDFLSDSNPKLNEELEALQCSAMAAGTSFALSLKDATKFQKVGLSTAWSNVRINPEIELPYSLSKIVVEVALGKNISKVKNLFVFVGSRYGPNLQAVDFLTKVASSLSENSLIVIIGKCSPKFKLKKIQALGFVDEITLAAFYKMSKFVIVPLFEGTGISIKTLEAQGYGCNIYATSHGARGLQDLNNLIVKDYDPKDYSIYAEDLMALSETSSKNQISGVGIEDLKAKFDDILLNHVTGTSSDLRGTGSSAVMKQWLYFCVNNNLPTKELQLDNRSLRSSKLLSMEEVVLIWLSYFMNGELNINHLLNFPGLEPEIREVNDSFSPILKFSIGTEVAVFLEGVALQVNRGLNGDAKDSLILFLRLVTDARTFNNNAESLFKLPLRSDSSQDIRAAYLIDLLVAIYKSVLRTRLGSQILVRFRVISKMNATKKGLGGRLIKLTLRVPLKPIAFWSRVIILIGGGSR